MDNLPKAPGFSVFYTDPREARWIVRGPENIQHLFGHAKNLEHNGFLIRDGEEARAMVRRAPNLTIERFGELDPFTPTEEESQGMKLIDRSYLWLWFRSDQLKIDPAEIPAAPCRRELFHFVRDKEALLARQTANTANLQAQVDKLQEQIGLLMQMNQAAAQPMPMVPSIPTMGMSVDSLPPVQGPVL